mmetsp:Transcript_17452/g.37708  ORF Transcript_17452/g.37708 Transcript_17452/m.37708 type:complete len:265 (-) Transcript_17452:121-915(-)
MCRPRPGSSPPAGRTMNGPNTASELAAAAWSSGNLKYLGLPFCCTTTQEASTPVGFESMMSTGFGERTCTRPYCMEVGLISSAGCRMLAVRGSGCTSPLEYETSSCPSTVKSSRGCSTAGGAPLLLRRPLLDMREVDGALCVTLFGSLNCKLTSTDSRGGRYVWLPNEEGVAVMPLYMMGSWGAEGVMDRMSNGPSVRMENSSGQVCRFVMVITRRYAACVSGSCVLQQVKDSSLLASGSSLHGTDAADRSTCSCCRGAGGLPA